MGWDSIGTLLEKYGLAIGVLFGVIFAIMKGYLVPQQAHERVLKELDDKSEEVKQIRAAMDAERLQFMKPMVEMFNNLKKDDIDDRGG